MMWLEAGCTAIGAHWFSLSGAVCYCVLRTWARIAERRKQRPFVNHALGPALSSKDGRNKTEPMANFRARNWRAERLALGGPGETPTVTVGKKRTHNNGFRSGGSTWLDSLAPCT